MNDYKPQLINIDSHRIHGMKGIFYQLIYHKNQPFMYR